MKIPKKLKLFNRTFEVVLDKDTLSAENNSHYPDGAVAYLDVYQHVIHLLKSDSLSEDELFNSLLHEIAHLLYRQIGMFLGGEDFELEEKNCNRFACFTLMIMKALEEEGIIRFE